MTFLHLTGYLGVGGERLATMVGGQERPLSVFAPAREHGTASAWCLRVSED